MELVENTNLTKVSSGSPSEPKIWVPVSAMSDQELRDYLQWPGQDDRRLLETACHNRKFTGYYKLKSGLTCVTSPPP